MGLRKTLDKIKQPFEKGEKYEKYRPLVQAFDTFFYVPDETTEKGAHVRDAVDLKRVMITVVLALVPALLFGIWNSGYQYLSQIQEEVGFWEAFGEGGLKMVPMSVVCYVVGLGIVFYCAVRRGMLM